MNLHLHAVRRVILLALVFGFTYSALAATTSSSAAPDIVSDLKLDVPATSFVLPNGLTVVVHEDHSTPLVAVNLWYHVGSKNEPEGKTGFAHLFEHLMFNGSEHFNDDFFKATQRLGATQQNGTTSKDRTNYFQTVPTGALDAMLWLESDRMGHLLGAIDQAKLDEQRAVVKNEKRQGDNRPYAKAWDLITRATTPVGHPYDHSVIGSMEDLDAASVDDVHDWFRTYYGPSNAVLVLAGDITPAEARAKVEKYFGALPPGTPVSQPRSWPVKRTGSVRETAYDRVAQPRLYRVWNVSDYASADTDYLQFLAQVLAGDKNSRLYKRLIKDEQLATAVSAGVDNREIGGQFVITADVKPGHDVDRVERIVDEELRTLLNSGPTAAQMARIRTSTLADFVHSLESIAAQASLLAESQTYLGSPDGWKEGFERYRNATPKQLQDAGRRWLSDGDYVLRILPFGDLKATGADVDRSAVPEPAAVVPATFPSVERRTLSNGMKLVVAKRSGLPLVNLTLLLRTGTPADYARVKPGTGSLAMALLDEGTPTRTGEQLVDALGGLGATLSSGGGGETSYVSLSALKPTLPDALAIFADVVRHPAFASADFDRLKGQTVTGIASAKQDPSNEARRLLPTLLFGADHPYGQLATEAAVQSIERADVAAFHRRWFHPNNATLIVTGDTDLATIKPLVEAAFAGWQRGVAPEAVTPMSDGPQTSVVYLIDKPGTSQTVIRAGLVAPPRRQGDDIAREAFNNVLGGGFTSRLNMSLREQKGWAYGASSGIDGGHGAQTFAAAVSVQADKSVDAMAEIARILAGIAGNEPVDAAELATARDEMSLGLTSAWATSNGIGQYLMDQQVYDLPDDYYDRYPADVAGLSLDAVNAEGKALIGQRPLTWVVVGDLTKIEAGIRALNLGDVQVVDADGTPVQ